MTDQEKKEIQKKKRRFPVSSQLIFIFRFYLFFFLDFALLLLVLVLLVLLLLRCLTGT